MKALRIWFGCVLGFAMCTVFGWSNGMFGALFPLFILSNLNRWNAQMFIQLLISIFWVGIQVSLIVGFLQPYPLLMTVAVGIMLLFKCHAMHYKASYLFGYTGLLVGSILLNFGSYPTFDLENFIIGVWVAAIMMVPICAMAFYLFPDPIEAHIPILKVEGQSKDPRDMLEQTALGWMVAMIVFLIFEIANLNDSLSAQASMLIMLSPMTLVGSLMMARIRIVGTLAGCAAAMAIQLVLYDLYDNPILYILSFAIASGYFCKWLASENPAIKGIGFSAMAALTIPITGAIPGQKDAFFSILYRVSSIVVAVIVTSILIWSCYRLIKLFPIFFRGVEREEKVH
ncbi:DUF2955 domain-containing protein [Aliivibrio finisterrensis]|uniref:DUF2955 domain-containing protein n=1 Tax=Aliivibrio finisterrensis TaxID=511998 RepID=A0A4Q5KQZ9_9GAMM|nr:MULTISPECIES: DUF2955 domain-containing protein [Aliivibrio]MDD9174089.1 DUF2955 domain-containing protein [Aliivibrio sp. S3TY1]MDD9191166.1 DUF2955 domain-containing protein [Aliivibrio sp. S2TY2]RYU48132.1 DUF2955 domain-containing protein [Aliivibrio finisterrensis]